MHSLSQISNKRFEARNEGYEFYMNADSWRLSKDVIVHPLNVTKNLNNAMSESYLRTLSYYAMEYSAGHVKAINNVFSKWAENFILDEINKSAILNFKIFLGPDHEHLINVVRRFIVKWNEFNYRGVDSEVISLFKKIHIKKAISGDSVKRKDPSKGPYTKEELEVIIKDIKTLYENKKIKLDCYCFMLLLIYTGRRTNQLTSLRVRDLINDNNCFYLNIPRAKQGGNFRSDFTKISITDCLYRLLYEQAQSIINIAEVFFEKTIAEKTKNELPLFIYKTGLENCVSEEEIFLKRKSDFLHAKKKR